MLQINPVCLLRSLLLTGKSHDNFKNTVPISEFVEYVNSMHADRDDQFEEEFDVSSLLDIVVSVAGYTL